MDSNRGWEGGEVLCLCGRLGWGGTAAAVSSSAFPKVFHSFLNEQGKGNWKLEVDEHSVLPHFWLPHVRNTQNIVGDMMPLYEISVVNVLRVIAMRADIMKLKMGAIVLK